MARALEWLGSHGLGWWGHYLLWANGGLYLLRRVVPAPGRGISAGLLLGMAGASLLPLDGVALYGYPAAFLGELGLLSQTLLTLALYRQLTGHAGLSFREKRFLLDAVALTGLLLYLFSSGITSFDLYSLGYGSRPLLLVLTLASAALWFLRPFVAVVIPIAIIGWQLGVLTSDNLWDYLLDVPLTLYALGSLWRREVTAG